jgi:NTE family protein
VSTTSYTTNQAVDWVQGKDPPLWSRPRRRAIPTRLHVDHVMASAALPIFFPAVQIGQEWYGDGGIGLTAPLSPALHLGAGRILTISTRNSHTAEAPRPTVEGYPPPAQVVGTLLSSIFLDVIDQDVARLERLNRLIRQLPRRRRGGLRPIDLLVMRPSQNLSRLARDFEPRLPRPLRFMSRGLGTRRTRDADLLSMIMFQEDYIRCLSELGESDAEARAEELEAFVRG